MTGKASNGADALNAARWARHPLHAFGDGPWLILPECPATRGHNTMQAVRGRFASDRATEPKCICPRALKLRADYLEIRNARKSNARRFTPEPPAPAVPTVKPENGVPVNSKLPIYMTNVKRHSTAEIPDLNAGACRTKLDAVWLMDRAIDGVTGALERARDELCFRCPVRQECLEMALAGEEPAGAWGGLYGGASPAERRRMTELRDGLVAA